jgi:hypothetical protein
MGAICACHLVCYDAVQSLRAMPLSQEKTVRSLFPSARTHTCHWGSILIASPVQDLSSGRGCPRLRTQAPEVTSQACEAFPSHVNETLPPGTALPLVPGRNINICNGPIIAHATVTYFIQLVFFNIGFGTGNLLINFGSMFSQFAVSVDSNWWEMGIESIHVGKTCPSVKIHSTGCSWLNYAPQGQFFPATNASQDFRNTPFQEFLNFLEYWGPMGPI